MPRNLAAIAAASAILVGSWLRARYVLRADFPLLDGGMFYTVVQDILANHFRPPLTLSYNGAGLPFAYPPLAFYLAAAFVRLGLNPFDALRALPLLATCLCLPAMWLLARSILGDPMRAAIATWAFAIIPQDFVWLIMGGGLTRAPGLLCSLLALHQAHRLATTRRRRFIAGTGILTGLTLLLHLETASFLTISLAAFWLLFNRKSSGLLSFLQAAGIAGLVSSPWWGTVIARYGATPLLAAIQSGGAGLNTHDMLVATAWRLLFALFHTGEPGIPIVSLLALVGLVITCLRKQWTLAIWLLTVVVLEPRAWQSFASPAIALLAAIGISDVLRPVLIPRLPQMVLGMLVLLIGAYGAAATMFVPSEKSELSLLVQLRAPETSAMQAVDQLTDADARFLVVSGTTWQADLFSEWLPALGERQTVNTVQGYEWVPDVFSARVANYNRLQACASRESTCLARWSEDSGVGFTDVYLPKWQIGDSVEPLRQSLRNDAAYRTIYDSAGATIFERIS
ncbi:MAG: glycosyltransferase family 39 protein [Chloroflexi bacterium]|nr:glycosyltransferase family 39 protein [Chloroflexota bacterium]